MKVLEGKPIAPGFARGRAFVLGHGRERSVPRYAIAEQDVPQELARFREAVQRSAEELSQVRDRVFLELGEAESKIFAVHLAMLTDEEFSDRVRARVRDDLVNVEQAFDAEVEDVVRLLSEVESEYLRERTQDVRDVGRRVLKHLGGQQGGEPDDLPPGSVIVARELLPSDTLHLDRGHVAAIVSERGGKTTHAAILARSLGVPAITGVTDATRLVQNGQPVLVEGGRGILVIAPSQAQIARFSDKKHDYDDVSRTADAAESAACVTRDGQEVDLLANIARPAETADVLAHNLGGVGLFRTEALFLGLQESPAVSAQRDIYAWSADRLRGLPLVIRTLDLGGDKKPRFLAGHLEANPDMGLRGLRFSIAEGALFRAQLRAILEAAEGRDIRILLPMVIGTADFRAAIEIARQVAAEMGATAVPPVGAMIETPAALYQLDGILADAAFLSIGTNDLTQFMLAADRNALDLIDECSVLHPAVLRAVRDVVRAAGAYEKPVCVCGEAAGEPATACLFAAFGIRQLSMSPVRAARVRQAIRALDLADAPAVVDAVTGAATPDEVRAVLLDAGLSGTGAPATA